MQRWPSVRVPRVVSFPAGTTSAPETPTQGSVRGYQARGYSPDVDAELLLVRLLSLWKENRGRGR